MLLHTMCTQGRVRVCVCVEVQGVCEEEGTGTCAYAPAGTQKIHRLKYLEKKKRKIDASALCVCLKFVPPPAPPEKASVCLQMILFQNPCQQFSSLFPACGFSYLDHLSRGTQATLCQPALSAQRAFHRLPGHFSTSLQQIRSVLTGDGKWAGARPN